MSARLDGRYRDQIVLDAGEREWRAALSCQLRTCEDGGCESEADLQQFAGLPGTKPVCETARFEKHLPSFADGAVGGAVGLAVACGDQGV